jgi:hypothetical protein
LSVVAPDLTGAVAAGCDGVFKDDVATAFLVSGNDDIVVAELRGFSKTGKKDNF